MLVQLVTMAELRTITNTRMVRVVTPSDLTREDVEVLLAQIATVATKVIGQQARWRLNYVKNGDVYVSYCFVLVEPEAFFHVILGNNPDGTSRVRSEIRQRPMPKVPPGLTWTDEPGVPYTIAKFMASWYDGYQEVSVIEPPIFVVPTDIKIEVAKFPDKYFSQNASLTVLSLYVAPWVTERQLIDEFRVYAAGDTGYPVISLAPLVPGQPTRNAKIGFRPCTLDALFALTMSRKVTLAPPNGGKPMTFNVMQSTAGAIVRGPGRGDSGRGGHGGGKRRDEWRKR